MKIAVAAAALVLLAPSAAEAAPWRQVTAPGGASIDQVGVARTADGVLHVAWHKGGDLFHTAVGADGRVGATTPIQSGWTGHQDAALTAVPRPDASAAVVAVEAHLVEAAFNLLGLAGAKPS